MADLRPEAQENPLQIHVFPVKFRTHDSGDHVDWNKAQRLHFPNLRVTLLERIKVAANKRDVPYQSLIKTWLSPR